MVDWLPLVYLQEDAVVEIKTFSNLYSIFNQMNAALVRLLKTFLKIPPT